MSIGCSGAHSYFQYLVSKGGGTSEVQGQSELCKNSCGVHNHFTLSLSILDICYMAQWGGDTGPGGTSFATGG